ncbi:restriction endonuclease subunit S [Flavobacterium sp.]|uniref:restriction endonuclease subunit S n=1 Tax=Flavobacterium sp. TaxID=239 RepID=UPI0039E47796
MSKKNKLIPELRFPEFEKGEEWEEKSLDKVVNDFIVPMRDKPKNLDGEIPWCRIEDFNGMYLSGSKSNQGVSSETIKGMNLKVYPINTLLVSCSADLGRCAITQKPLVTNQTFIGLVPNQKKVNTVYLYYVMTNSRNELNARSSGTTISYLSRQEFEKFEITLPNLKEQQKIASCLSSLDDLIESHKQKLDLLKDHKKGLMQNLFPQEGEKVPKYRFKEFENDGEWVSHKIGDFIESHKGGAPLTPSDFVDKSDFEVIPKKAINDGGLLNMDMTSPTYCTENFYNNNKKSVVDSSFLITTLRDLVPSGPNIGYIVKFNGIKKYILAQGVYGLKPKNTIDPDFLIQFSNTLRYRKLVNAAMVGSTQVHIRNSEFLNLPIHAPKKLEQQKIASCLTSLDKLITQNTEKIEQLKKHKKGLMQGLFPKMSD